jgi:hypothetical protein
MCLLKSDLKISTRFDKTGGTNLNKADRLDIPENFLFPLAPDINPFQVRSIPARNTISRSHTA